MPCADATPGSPRRGGPFGPSLQAGIRVFGLAVSLRATVGAPEEEGRSGIRVDVRGSGAATIETGLPVLDRLLEQLVAAAEFDVMLEVEPGGAEAEISEAGSALGRALAEPLRAGRGYGSAMMTSSEALANVVLEASDTP